MTKISTKDWRSLPLDRWNVTTFHAYIVDRTSELYGVDYAPGGGGSKSARWSREKGMLKQAQGTYGNAVLRKFIDLCHANYTPKREYPYPAFTFMYAYQDRLFAQAQTAIAEEKRREGALTGVEERAKALADEDWGDWL